MNQQLNEIKEALHKATPGPWEKRADAVNGPQGWICQMYEGEEDSDDPTREFLNAYSNAYLIANAPQWLTSLVSEVERLQTIEEHAIKRIKTETQANSEYAKQVEEMQKTLVEIANMRPSICTWSDEEYYENFSKCEQIAQQTLQSLKGEDKHE